MLPLYYRGEGVSSKGNILYRQIDLGSIIWSWAISNNAKFSYFYIW